MDYELVLDHHYDRIAQDLDVYEIKDYIKKLEEIAILQPEEVRSILDRDESNDNITRAKRLLDIFKTRLQSKIRGFIEHLKTPYLHLYEDFNDDLKKITNIDELPTTRNHIRRREALENIKLHLKVSTTFVVIYGMPGQGKTNLAVEAAMYFALQKRVYWVNASGAAGDRVKILRMLLSRVKHNEENQKSQSDAGQLASLLRGLLTEDDLVILDNVTNDVDLSILKSLPPKFIITTTDTAIKMYLDSPEMIVMNHGFTKEESLELISKVLQKEVNDLPPYVVNIHKHFKGYPLAVTLIANQLAHCPENDWFEYCQFSDDNDTAVNNRRSSTDRYLGLGPIDTTMKKCIQSLSEENQYYYKMLAIFKDNVFLTTKTLQVLWGCVNDIYKVRTILDELEDKSMVIKNYKVSFQTDVYEIHSTVLNSLRRLQEEDGEDIKKTHQSFVNNYIELYENIADIEDDHYIFYYLIYHIISAGVLQEFKSKLFNLDYILAKLVACGPNDMAEDLKLYKDELEEAGFDKQRLEEAAKFSERFGWDIYHTKVKDIQFFLQMPEDSLLFQEAMKRCKENNLLVLKSKWLTPRMITKEYPFQSVVKKLFCLQDNEILCEKWIDDNPSIVFVKLGDVKETHITDGSILCICVETGNMLYSYKKRVFSKQVGGGRTPDSSRQMNGDRSFFGAPSFGRPIAKLNKVVIAAFCQSGEKVVFATNAEKGVYHVADDTLNFVRKTSEVPVSTPVLCCFCWVHGSEIVMFATLAREIFFYEMSSLELIIKFEHPTKIVDMAPIPHQKELLVLSEESVTILSWKHGPQTFHSQSPARLTIGELSSRKIYNGPNKCLKCLATSQWIAIATTDGCEVRAYTKEHQFAKEHKFFRVGYGKVAALDIVDNTLTVVTSRSGSCKDTCVGRISVYNLQKLERGQPRPYLTDACQRWPIQRGYLLGIVDPRNVVFYQDSSKIFEAEIPDREPISIAMSLMGDIAGVGDAQNGVHFISPFNKKQSEPIILREPADFLKMDSTGKFVVAGSNKLRRPGPVYSFYIIASRKPIKHYDIPSPVFDCFFEGEYEDVPLSTREGLPLSHALSKKNKDTNLNVNIVLVFKNGLHSVYDTANNSYSYSEYEGHPYGEGPQAYSNAYLTCAAYHNHMLIKGVGSSLHVFNLKEKNFHKSKNFDHPITSCCIEPHESSHSQQQPVADSVKPDSSKPWVAVALATHDQCFQIVVCCRDLNELRRIHLDYAKEPIQQMLFSKSQTILMARCDWLCFWDVSDSSKLCAKTSRSTLHSAWKSHPTPLGTKDKLIARFKLQLEVLSLLPSEDFASFAVVHKKGDRRFLNVVDYNNFSNIHRNGSYPSMKLDL